MYRITDPSAFSKVCLGQLAMGVLEVAGLIVFIYGRESFAMGPYYVSWLFGAAIAIPIIAFSIVIPLRMLASVTPLLSRIARRDGMLEIEMRDES